MPKGASSGIETVLLIAIAIAITIFVMKTSGTSTTSATQLLHIPSAASSVPLAPAPAPVVVNVKGGDDRFSIAPRPQQVWNPGPDMSVLRNNPIEPIFTRGVPDAYQQLGVISGEDGKVLPLYGRRTGARSDRFNYYTRTDTYNPVALPIAHKKRDCQDGVGCDELMNGDEVKLGATGQHAKVTLYGLDGPRYVG
jgi:hypothetical protein